MTATAHVLVGGAIASSIQNPILGITLSAASHPLMDLIPHWDFAWGWRKKTKLKLFIQASADLIFGTIISYLIFGQGINSWYFLACIVASLVWDIMEAPYWFLNWQQPPFIWFYKIGHHIQGKARLPFGILTQVATVAVAIFMLNLY